MSISSFNVFQFFCPDQRNHYHRKIENNLVWMMYSIFIVLVCAGTMVFEILGMIVGVSLALIGAVKICYPDRRDHH